MRSIVQQLMRHMVWADAQVYDAVKRSPEALGDAAIRDLLHHTHAVQWVYLHIWRGETPDVPEAEDFPDLSAVERWGRRAHVALHDFTASVSDDELARLIEFPWRRMLEERWGEARPATLEETMAQVASHSAYHRGQVNRRLREIGGEPPLTDFVAWIWEGKPDAPVADTTPDGAPW